MLAKAQAKYVRISSSKVRLVADLVRGKSVEQAVSILDNINKRAGRVIRKVVDSAFSNLNYHRQEKLSTRDAYISGIIADNGPMLKRFRAATMGRATPIRHRTAHIKVELDALERPGGEEKPAEVKAQEKEPKVEAKASSKKPRAAKKTKTKKKLAGSR